MITILLLQASVRVPVRHTIPAILIGTAEEFDKSHTTLEQSPGKDAVAGESCLQVIFVIRAIAVQCAR